MYLTNIEPSSSPSKNVAIILMFSTLITIFILKKCEMNHTLTLQMAIPKGGAC